MRITGSKMLFFFHSANSPNPKKITEEPETKKETFHLGSCSCSPLNGFHFKCLSAPEAEKYKVLVSVDNPVMFFRKPSGVFKQWLQFYQTFLMGALVLGQIFTI